VVSPIAVVLSVLPVYLLILAGGILRKMRILRVEHDGGMMQLVYAVMLPCFILDKILGSAVLKSGSVVVWSISLGFLLILVSIGIGLLVGRLCGLERGSGMRSFALAAGCQNYGFTAAPVIESLWGGGALALLFVHNIGVELAMWSVGVMILSGERGLNWKRLINGPIIAVSLGLLAVACGVDQHLSGPVRKAISMLGSGAFPVALCVIGCTMADLMRAERPTWRVVCGASLVRLVLAPLVILAAAKYLPIPVELRQVLLVQAAMPAGMIAILLAKLYGGRPAIAVQIVIATSLLSLLTLPWVITWGSQWLELKPGLP
jgi:malate permease and related proteins